jgi:hypothetical protein
VHKVHSRFCKKMGVLICAASGSAEMELGRESRRGKCIGQIVRYCYQIMCLDIEDLARQCSKWQNSNWSVRSRTMELKEELCNIRLALVWTQEECNLQK